MLFQDATIDLGSNENKWGESLTSPFIRRYAKYVNDKVLSYGTVAFDFCKVKRGKQGDLLRTMNADALLKTLPVLQAQLDSLLEVDFKDELINGKI